MVRDSRLGVQQVSEAVALVAERSSNVRARADGATKPVFWVCSCDRGLDDKQTQVGCLQLSFRARSQLDRG